MYDHQMYWRRMFLAFVCIQFLVALRRATSKSRQSRENTNVLVFSISAIVKHLHDLSPIRFKKAFMISLNIVPKIFRIISDVSMASIYSSYKQIVRKVLQSQTKSIGTEAILQLKKHFLTAYILVNKFFQKLMFDL